jgi:hypothetical protein
MAKTQKHLWEKVASLGNLMQAANLAMRGKRSLAPAAVMTALVTFTPGNCGFAGPCAIIWIAKAR